MSNFKAWADSFADFISGRAATKKQEQQDEKRRKARFLQDQNDFLRTSLFAVVPAELIFCEISEEGDRWKAIVVYDKKGKKREMVQMIWHHMLADPAQRTEWLKEVISHILYDLKERA